MRKWLFSWLFAGTIRDIETNANNLIRSHNDDGTGKRDYQAGRRDTAREILRMNGA